MTTTATHAFVGPLTASGTIPLPFNFQAISDDEVGVMRNGVEVLTGFTIALNGDGTGQVNPTSSWGTDEVYIFSKPTYQQEAEFERIGPFYPDNLNHPLDVLGRQIIALRDLVSRTFVGPIGSTGDVIDLSTDGVMGVLAGDLHFYPVGDFVGPEGPPGDTGDQGIQGVQGDPGAPGAPASNPNYTYAINTLAPGASATLTPSGTYPNVLLTFGIPRGDPGASGALGDGTYSGIIVSGGGTALDVGPNHITLARMANLAANSLIGNATGGAATPTALDATTVKTLLSLGNVNNTTDANKPISTATQTALDLKANLASPALTGNPTAPTQSAGSNNTRLATTAYVKGEVDVSVQTAGSNSVTPTYDNDMVIRTGASGAITLNNPTGTAIDGHGIVIRLKDNGTARAISYGSEYRAIGVTLPTTTVINKTLYIGMIRNNTDTKWDVVSVSLEA
jgi:hypothetical protein